MDNSKAQRFYNKFLQNPKVLKKYAGGITKDFIYELMMKFVEHSNKGKIVLDVHEAEQIQDTLRMSINIRKKLQKPETCYDRQLKISKDMIDKVLK